MKKFISEFIRRGLIACGFGPIVLAMVYLVLKNAIGLETLTINQICIGIFSLAALAFVSGGMNALYQLERLPLMVAILIHGGVLYISYLVTYLLNDWLESGTTPIFIFSGIFVLGYLIIWIIIYSMIKKNTEEINQVLAKKRGNKNTEYKGEKNTSL